MAGKRRRDRGKRRAERKSAEGACGAQCSKEVRAQRAADIEGGASGACACRVRSEMQKEGDEKSVPPPEAQRAKTGSV